MNDDVSTLLRGLRTAEYARSVRRRILLAAGDRSKNPDVATTQYENMAEWEESHVRYAGVVGTASGAHEPGGHNLGSHACLLRFLYSRTGKTEERPS